MTDYRVDDLAHAAGTTSRNVRLYQERGLLPAPRRVGRVAWYGETHLARLRLITRLLDRGYSLANIAELLQTWESGRDLTNVLGVEQVITMPWNDEDPAPVTLSGLRDAFGSEFGVADADRLVEIGLLQRHGSRYQLPSPALLGVAHELVGAGLPLGAVMRLAETLVEHMGAVARDFIATTSQAIGPDVDAALLGETSAKMRPLAQLAVTRAFAIAMDRETVAAFAGLSEPHAAPRARRPISR